MKDHKEKYPKSEKDKKSNLEDQVDSGITKDFEEINSAEADSNDNVVGDTRSETQNRKHGRDHGDPLTGTTPKTDS